MKIPAGYIITYRTWENDGDNYKSHRYEGLTEQKVKDIKEFLEMFHSENYPKNGKRSFGNAYGHLDIGGIISRHTSMVDAIVDRKYTPEELEEIDDEFLEVEDEIKDLISEYLGRSEDYESRVYNNDLKILYNPTEVDLEDVTKNF
jgi:hypothetical protein